MSVPAHQPAAKFEEFRRCSKRVIVVNGYRLAVNGKDSFLLR
jgi:hypothetical protein